MRARRRRLPVIGLLLALFMASSMGVSSCNDEVVSKLLQAAEHRGQEAKNAIEERGGIRIHGGEDNLCSLFEAYESEGSFEDFGSWVLRRSEESPEEAFDMRRELEDFADAAQQAESEDEFGAFASVVCGF